MKKKHIIVLAYLLLALGYGIHGLCMLLAPEHWFAAAPLPLVKDNVPAFFVQWLGLATLTMALLFVWCLRHLKRRKLVHLALTFFVVGTALLNGMEVAMAVIMPTSAAFWLPMILFIFLPALAMLVMALPPMPVRVKGPREQGRVKWFNATKGFGFITRDQGDDVFVHYRSIRGEGHRTLREGQQVEFVVVKGEKGLQAEDIQPL